MGIAPSALVLGEMTAPSSAAGPAQISQHLQTRKGLTGRSEKWNLHTRLGWAVLRVVLEPDWSREVGLCGGHPQIYDRSMENTA
jgi:hypothetical protein